MGVSRVPAPAATDETVQRQAQEPDEHVIWMDTTSGAVFMVVSPKYCGEISGLEHAWNRLRSHLQVNRLREEATSHQLLFIVDKLSAHSHEAVAPI
jgi:hypothetical protein